MQLRRNVLVAVMAGLSILLMPACGTADPTGTASTEPMIQGPVAESWVAHYNGPASSADTAWDLAVDDLGNSYVAGLSYTSADNVDYCIAKYDSNGKPLWISYYDGPSHGEDRAWAIALDKLGNAYVTGESQGNGTDYDYATVKYGSDGIELWAARYNGPASGSDVAGALMVDEACNVYVTGESQGNGTECDYATVKYDPDGKELWASRYNGPASGNDSATAIVFNMTGSLYVTGRSQGNGTDYDYATVKYDSDGRELWTARYNGPGSTTDSAFDMAIDSSGNIYVTGISGAGATGEDKNINYDYATVKYSSEGQKIWVTRYDGPTSGTDAPSAVAVDLYDNVYVSGSSGDSRLDTAKHDYATVKYSSEGEEIWVTRYDGMGSGYNYVSSLALDSSGNVYVTGESIDLSDKNLRHSCGTIKYNSDGQEIWIARYDSHEKQVDYINAIAVDASSSVYIMGNILRKDTDTDFFVVKYTQPGS